MRKRGGHSCFEGRQKAFNAGRWHGYRSQERVLPELCGRFFSAYSKGYEDGIQARKTFRKEES